MHKKAVFIGTRKELCQEIKAVDGFPFASYLNDEGLPVLFANTPEDKEILFNECKELGIEVIDGTLSLERKDA